MCEFLKGPEHKDMKKIAELTIRANAEKHVCDALFATLSEAKRNPSSPKMNEASDLYSRLLLARSTNDFSGLEEIAHHIMGEQNGQL
jgi:hypothetical protein